MLVKGYASATSTSKSGTITVLGVMVLNFLKVGNPWGLKKFKKCPCNLSFSFKCQFSSFVTLGN